MIPVRRQPEPESFEAEVRRPGLAWLEERGWDLDGPLPSGEELRPFWRAALGELHRRYRGVCAYVCIEIPEVTGARTVDHFVAKSGALRQAYEWSNYRLACQLMNSRKRDFDDVLDPFDLEDETFYLNFANGEVYPNPGLEAARLEQARATVERLHLNGPECTRARLRHFELCFQEEITLSYLQRVSPFVHQEARRQGFL